ARATPNSAKAAVQPARDPEKRPRASWNNRTGAPTTAQIASPPQRSSRRRSSRGVIAKSSSIGAGRSPDPCRKSLPELPHLFVTFGTSSARVRACSVRFEKEKCHEKEADIRCCRALDLCCAPSRKPTEGRRGKSPGSDARRDGRRYALLRVPWDSRCKAHGLLQRLHRAGSPGRIPGG